MASNKNVLPIPLENNPNNINNNGVIDGDSDISEPEVQTESDTDSEPDINQIDKTRRNEYRAFPWRCLLCNIVAMCPMSLQLEFEDNHGPYMDGVEGKLWIACNKCAMKFHLSCLGLTPQTVIIPFLCPIFGCAEGTEQDPAHGLDLV